MWHKWIYNRSMQNSRASQRRWLWYCGQRTLWSISRTMLGSYFGTIQFTRAPFSWYFGQQNNPLFGKKFWCNKKCRYINNTHCSIFSALQSNQIFSHFYRAELIPLSHQKLDLNWVDIHIRLTLLIIEEKSRNSFGHWYFTLVECIPHNSCPINMILDSIIDISLSFSEGYSKIHGLTLVFNIWYNYFHRKN